MLLLKRTKLSRKDNGEVSRYRGNDNKLPQGINTLVTSQNVLIVFTEFLKVLPVISFFSTRFFSSSTNFKMELKAQLGSCRPLSANRLHLLSNVGPSREIALKQHYMDWLPFPFPVLIVSILSILPTESN